METKSVWQKYTKTDEKKVFEFAEDYKSFMSECKTEKECTEYFKNRAIANGFKDFETLKNKKLKAGDKVFFTNMKKSIILFVVGKDPLEKGMNILGAHIDSPRLDIKQNPLYEDGDLALLDTHYYGGIKKYQWVTLPLSIHGVVAKKDGSLVTINIGEKDDDPVFFVSDLLIHLSQEQLEKKGAKVIEGEALDIIVGNKPIKISSKKDEKNDTKATVKSGILDILKKEYKIEEEDFYSAELEIVPAGKAKDAGLDRSMILAYGHDDRVCSYPSFEAIISMTSPNRTSCCILIDKEEIGSVGATGMKAKFFENSVAELINSVEKYSELTLRRCLSNSFMLSSDVTSAYDPTYAGSFDKKNVAYLGHGMDLKKFTGARGKSSSNDANAEYLAKVRAILDKNKVSFQVSELGKVDLGGGGTIAYILALYGMCVMDCGVPVLNMHAPWEAISKADLYEAYKGYMAFLKEA